jgi:hypothetical protein
VIRAVYLDDYVDRVFDLRRYNCWHFARDVWRDTTGVDLGDLTPTQLAPGRLAETATVHAASARFRRVAPPRVEPCLVLAERPRWMPHIGVLLRGRVLNLSRDGVRHQSIASFAIGFQSLGFFVPEDSSEPKGAA